ncbi:FAD/NAD(P)-binding domain-containing protein [Parathielavia appendiculata]|uniref:FAD/NAD(P)-binding domain-containing protein n=1 Tax=Parathielavia appendiculata TaxID=2587402 RepID=A0AAN6TQU1_9PEZI|nr:FAD/NAD(P)-binding domain-containing protein [Parathielavia appendiculata]
MHVAIAGAGIAGLGLALLLQQKSIPCVVYELRASTATTTGALMLAPNAMRILEEIGLLARIQKQGHSFDTIFFKDSAGQTTDQFLMGSIPRYGYHAMRIHRHTVISRALEENQDGVTFQFADGSTDHASVLIGADGIHSYIRGYVCLGYSPVYSGQIALSAVTQQGLPERLEDPRCSLPAVFHGRNGALLMLPQSFDGSEVIDRAGWTRLANDGEELFNLWKQGIGEWHGLVPSVLESVRHDAISIWPYYALPSIPRWVSSGKRVILVGDAAHAIAPTAGQGACQALEDALTLSVLFSSLFFPVVMGHGLDFWEKVRRERVERVKALTLQLGNNRLPQEEREKLPSGQYWKSGEQPDRSWLYRVHVGEEFSRLYANHDASVA